MQQVATFYHFADFADFRDWRAPLREKMREQGVTGSILLAAEGINATIAGPESGVAAVLDLLRADDRFRELFVKISWAEVSPFQRAKVRLKRETITLNQPTDAACLTGTLVPPEAWNDLIAQPDVLLLDTRNDYETHLGTFEGATVWPLKDFQEIAGRIRESIGKRQKVAMFCTGGVRCEKLSSWMILEGYEHLYQLEGGILHYLNTVPPEQSKWRGDCYVFDSRVAVSHGCRPAAEISMCPACGHALTLQDREHPHYLPAIRCGFCTDH